MEWDNRIAYFQSFYKGTWECGAAISQQPMLTPQYPIHSTRTPYNITSLAKFPESSHPNGDFRQNLLPKPFLSHNGVITASWMFSQSKSYMANFTPMTGKGGTCYRGVQTICQARLETHHWDHQRGMGFDGLILTFQICSCLTSWCHVMMLDIFQKDVMSVHITERLS